MTEDDKANNVADIDVEDGKELDYLRSQDNEKTPEEKEEVTSDNNNDESKVEDQREEKKDDHVPYAKFHEERMRRKELKERLDKQEQRFQELMQKLAPQEEQKSKPPVFENDVEALKYQQEQISRTVEEQRRFVEEQRRAQEQASQVQALVRAYSSKASEYEKSQADFRDAYGYFIENRRNEYLAAGYSAEQAEQFVQNDELAIVAKAFQDEVNPAERIYKVAQTRGYQPKKKEPDKLETIEKGLKQGKTLSGVPGSSPKGLTLEAIAEMDDDEFSKLDYEEIRRLAGQK